jgi:hypothetical protein
MHTDAILGHDFYGARTGYDVPELEEIRHAREIQGRLNSRVLASHASPVHAIHPAIIR